MIRLSKDAMCLFAGPVAGLALTLAFAGCATSRMDENIVPLTVDQTKALATKARSPALFGITVYPSDKGPVFVGATRLHESQMAAATFDGGALHSPIIDLLGGSGSSGKIKALIDTSSPQSWLTLASARAINAELLGDGAMFGELPDHVVDTVPGFASAVPKVRIEELHVESSVFYTRSAEGPLGALGRWAGPSQAVLGMSFLKSFDHVILNYPEQWALFSSTGVFKGNEEALITRVPMQFVEGSLAADVQIDGEPVLAVLDSAGDFALAMTNPPPAAIRQISVGDLVVRQVTAVNGVERGLGSLKQPRIGRRVLEKFKVILDFRNKEIVFERP